MEENNCWQNGQHCWCTVIYFFTALASISSTLTIAVVVRSPKLRGRSTFVFLTFMAVVDLMTLVGISIYCSLEPVTQFWNTNTKCVYYSAIYWINDSTVMLSCIFILMVTVERFVVVHFPIRGREIFTQRNAILLSVFVSVVVFALNSNAFWSFEPDHQTNKCNDTEVYERYLKPIRYYSTFAVTTATWVSLVGFCLAIIYKLRATAALRRRLSLTDVHTSFKSTHLMLLCTAFTFVVLVGPLCIVDVIHVSLYLLKQDDTHLTYIRENVFLLSKLNHCVNFVLYVMTAAVFREEFFALLALVTCRREKEQSPYRQGAQSCIETKITHFSEQKRLSDF
ncbi:uncharacterized protein LOC106175607 [Lingula anatina]|uniref:Uncharacterized protein LOC106175607 n=1 Tax=Lingula anatina TaxID=7574 RepID=A0A1S3JS04_LINAN|nr:uncharacterized protein LOC106175607 [Lingula anatina]XP_013413151.1 uncharacterized protein LOC106175607 [Lingula anatina]|eukprot:XP_013413150.1 uncharacterized protein LOC106175607 [Lingula anatina]